MIFHPCLSLYTCAALLGASNLPCFILRVHNLNMAPKESKAVTGGLLWKNVFSKIPQNSQENICAIVSLLIKLQASVCNFIKRKLWHRCFPVNFAKFLRTTFYRTPSADCFQKISKNAKTSLTHNLALLNMFLENICVKYFGNILKTTR